MKTLIVRISAITLAMAVLFTLSACGREDSHTPIFTQPQPTVNVLEELAVNASTTPTQEQTTETAPSGTELYVSFGDSAAFSLHLYDNPTAEAIAYHVGTSPWQLPIYHYDDFENWEVMQYYDIPSRYEIPSNPESVTAEAAGAVYYSEPNRIILFYGDAQVPAEYTPVGWFDFTDEFYNAVVNNPVQEGWGNKLIHISAYN